MGQEKKNPARDIPQPMVPNSGQKGKKVFSKRKIDQKF